MHDTAYKIGGLVMETYLPPSPARILEIGSQNVNGSLRDHSPRNAEYTGLDFEAGNGVDTVVTGLDDWNVPDAHFDLVMASSVFEHDFMFWKTFLAMCRKTKPGGHIYISVPSNGLVHRYPQDCWRFYPDSGLALEAWARSEGYVVTLIESFTALRENDCWNDFCAIFQVDGTGENLNCDFVSAKFPSENIIHWRSSTVGNPQVDPEDLRLWKRSLQEAQELHVERDALLQGHRNKDIAAQQLDDEIRRLRLECELLRQAKANEQALTLEIAEIRSHHAEKIAEADAQLALVQSEHRADSDKLRHTDEQWRTAQEQLRNARKQLSNKDEQGALLNKQIEDLEKQRKSAEQGYEQRFSEQRREMDALNSALRKKDDQITREKAKSDWLQGVVAVLTRGFAPSWKSRFSSLLPAALLRSKQRQLLRKNGLFNGDQYLDRYPDVAKSGNDPFRHYILFGLNEGRHHDS